MQSKLRLGRDAVGRRRAALQRSFLSLPPPRRPQGLLKRSRPPVVPALDALGEPRARLWLPCARCGLGDKFSRARHSRSRSPVGGAGAEIRDPREEQGRGSMKGTRGRKTDKKQLLNSTQQVVAHICRDSVRATRLRPPKLSSLFPLGSVAWYRSSMPPPPPPPANV